MTTTILTDSELERQARRRAGAKLGWIIHALVFVAVNTLLALMAGMSGRNWAIYPAFGWAIGLAVHGLAVYMLTGAGGLHDKLLQGERARLQKDAW